MTEDEPSINDERSEESEVNKKRDYHKASAFTLHTFEITHTFPLRITLNYILFGYTK